VSPPTGDRDKDLGSEKEACEKPPEMVEIYRSRPNVSKCGNIIRYEGAQRSEKLVEGRAGRDK
jgi:hypothetical protein